MTREKLFYNIYLLGFVSLAVAVPTSNYVMSLSQIIMAGAWLFYGHYREGWKQLLSEKIGWILISFFILHVIGLIYTSDFNYAIKDLRTKLPLLVLPFIIFSMPRPSKRFLEFVVWMHALAILVASIIGIFLAQQKGYINYRLYSPGISHIRFGLNICLSGVLLTYYFFHLKNLFLRICAAALVLWYIVYLFLFGSVTAFIILCILFIIGISVFIIRHTSLWGKISYAVLLTALIVGFVLVIRETLEPFLQHSNKKIDITQLEKYSADGHPYLHDTIYFGKEFGQYVGLYYCPDELPEAWAKRSKLDYYGKDLAGQPLMATIVRYLNSKGLRKDARGLAQLSDEEIRWIEKGVANAQYMQSSALKRTIMETALGYEHFKEGNGTRGNSIMQRFELWRVSLKIIEKNPIIGVGTGDVPLAFKQQLAAIQSDLSATSLRSHNQYLSITIAFGIIGLLWFLWVLFYPLKIKNLYKDGPYMAFLIIIMVSMINEDTLESQAGITFYVFFSLFLYLLSTTKETVKSSISNR